MITSFDDLPLFQNHNRIGIADSRKPVGDHESRAVCHQTVHALFDVLLGSRINRTGRLI